MAWLQFNNEIEAQEASTKAKNFAELSSTLDSTKVSEAQSIANGWWVELPNGIPTDPLSPVLVSSIHPDQIITNAVRQRHTAIFDALDDLMREVMIENSIMGITDAQSRIVSDAIRDIWFYMQVSPNTAIEELDAMLALDPAVRAPGADAFVSTARLQSLRSKIVDIISGV